MSATSPVRRAVDQYARWREHPSLMVRELFGATPDPFQDELLEAKEPRVAMKASKGPGKTCGMAWRAWNFMLCYPHPNIAATSISADNLRDNLFKEMVVWYNKSPLLQANFTCQVERIFHKEHPATWFMSARSWPKAANAEEIGNTLAGLHSDYIMFLIDESGSIPPAITMSAEAALSSCKVGYIIQAGNTNTLEGALYQACVRRRHLWKVIQITGDPDDPKRSSRVSLEWARELVNSFGREDPFVKVMVLGEWPTASVNALLGPEDIERAQAQQYQRHHIDFAPRIFGVDVADEGDDASVIFPRQGLVAFKPHVLRNVSGEIGALQISRAWQDWTADACFIDNTGGYAGTWRSALKALNRDVIPVGFSEKPADPQYYNRRAEMYFLLAEWIKRDGGCLPDVPELMAELTQTTYTIKGDKLLLEDKRFIKAKIGRSPDRADALALTFAAPVAARKLLAAQSPIPRKPEAEYDPFESLLRA